MDMGMLWAGGWNGMGRGCIEQGIPWQGLPVAGTSGFPPAGDLADSARRHDVALRGQADQGHTPGQSSWPVARGAVGHGASLASGGAWQRPRHGHSPCQLQHHHLGLGGAADDPHDRDGLLLRVPRARVLEERPQLHLIARQVGVTTGQGHEGTGGSHHPTPQPQPYQEEKHWRVLITHCSFTRDPPQKCTPALQGRGMSSGGTLSTWQCMWDSRSPVADADSPGRVARLATNDAPLLLQPLIPLATLFKCHHVCGQGGHQPGLHHQHLPQGAHPAPTGPHLHSP